MKDVSSGSYVTTKVRRIRDKAQLKEFTEETGWDTDRVKLYDFNEIYALYVEDNTEVQGLVALYPDGNANSVYISWMCAAPHNQKGPEQKYVGVGGHLFAVAADRSFHYGLRGELYGFASNSKLYDHYAKELKAIQVGILHDYHFIITSDVSKEIMEVYDYDYELSVASNKK